MSSSELWHDTTALQAEATTIQYFGLGFVQVKCGAKQRLHYYHPDLPASVAEEAVHNHRYAFTSRVMKGLLEQELYCAAPSPAPTHYLTQESCEPDAHESETQPVALTLQARLMLPAGIEYWLAHTQLHRVKALGKTVTHLTRPSEHTVPLADVATPIDQPLVCPFESTLTESELWEIVRDTLAT